MIILHFLPNNNPSLGSEASKLLVYCSSQSSEIQVCELETKRKYASFSSFQLEKENRKQSF